MAPRFESASAEVGFWERYCRKSCSARVRSLACKACWPLSSAFCGTAASITANNNSLSIKSPVYPLEIQLRGELDSAWAKSVCESAESEAPAPSTQRAREVGEHASLVECRAGV